MAIPLKSVSVVAIQEWLQSSLLIPEAEALKFQKLKPAEIKKCIDCGLDTYRIDTQFDLRLIEAYVHLHICIMMDFVETKLPVEIPIFKTHQGLYSLMLRNMNVNVGSLSFIEISESQFSVAKNLKMSSTLAIYMFSELIKLHMSKYVWSVLVALKHNIKITEIDAQILRTEIAKVFKYRLSSIKEIHNVVEGMTYSGKPQMPKFVVNFWNQFNKEVIYNRSIIEQTKSSNIVDNPEHIFESWEYRYLYRAGRNAEIISQLIREKTTSRLAAKYDGNINDKRINSSATDLLQLFATVNNTWYNSGWMDNISRLYRHEDELLARINSMRLKNSDIVPDHQKRIIERIFFIADFQYLMFVDFDNIYFKNKFSHFLDEIISMISSVFFVTDHGKICSNMFNFSEKSVFQIDFEYGRIFGETVRWIYKQPANLLTNYGMQNYQKYGWLLQQSVL